MSNSNPENTKLTRCYAEVLADLSVVLEPGTLEELVDDLKGMIDCGVPGLNFEPRGSTAGYDIGKITIPIGDSRFVISHLLEVEWHTPLADRRGIMVQAGADLSGNRHPKLLVIDCPIAGKLPGGMVRSVIDEEVVAWLDKFLDDVGHVQELVNQFWYTPRSSHDPPRILHFTGGIWQPVDS